MTRAEIRTVVLRALGEIAPEVDLARLDARASLRDQLDLDSMDVLNFATALHAALGVDVPEVEYAKIGTLAGAIEYLAAQLHAEG